MPHMCHTDARRCRIGSNWLPVVPGHGAAERRVLIHDAGERGGDVAVVLAGKVFGEADHAARSQCQPDIAGLADRGLVEGWLSTWAG
jgi:hypothetical protein